MKKQSRKGQHLSNKKNQPTRSLRTSPAGAAQRESLPPKRPGPVVPGEFEPQEALVFGCGQLVRYYPQLFADFVRVTHERIRLIGLIAPEWRKLGDLLLGACGLPLDAVEFVEATTTSVWARDWSPIFGYDASGKRCQIYLNRSHMRHRDDMVARESFQKLFPDSAVELPLAMEGGNFLSNGKGLILTSQSVVQTNQSCCDRSQIASIFEKTFGSSTWASLLPLHGERTAHVDLLATFLRPDFLVIGEVKEKDDPMNYRSLNEAAEKLNGLITPAGKLEVARIPMGNSQDTYFRSYNNVIFANQTLLVPTFPRSDPKLDRQVIERYRDYLPGWEVIGLEMSELALKGGALHCLSVNVPPPSRVPTALTGPIFAA